MRIAGKKILEAAVIAVIVVLLVGAGYWFGYGDGRNVPKNVVISDVANMQAPSSTNADFSTFWEAWQTINDLYLRNPSTTQQQKVYGAIAGLVGSLGDPYSQFFTPQGNQQFQQDITGDFGGVGIQIDLDENSHLVVVSPLTGTPGANAGLMPKDWITAINGTSTDGMSVNDAVNLIRGPVGSVVTLSIYRNGWAAPKDVKITRETINVPNVLFEMKGDIAHITLTEFTQDAESEFYNALTNALNANAKGIVLDLRDDPGGYLEVAVDLAGYFLKPNSLVAKEVGRAVPEQDYTSSGDGALANFPMIILVNGGTASAAEILSGALHDDRSVKLVGERTFGKGTVQELEPLTDGSAIKLTVAHWVLPSGRILDHDGLVPDYVVTSTPAAASSTTVIGTEPSGPDPQLDKAIQLLHAEINGTSS